MAVKDLNEHYKRFGVWFDIPEDTEDFGLDITAHRSGWTGEERWVEDFKAELKTIGTEHGNIYTKDPETDKESWYRTVACRNSRCRYGLTGDTDASQEAVENDRTPRPDWCRTDAPLHVLNANTKTGGYEGCKMSALLKDRRNWVVFMYSHGYIIYEGMDELERAIVGKLWIYQSHTKRHRDRSMRWNLKVAIDLDAPTDFIKAEIPEDLLKENE